MKKIIIIVFLFPFCAIRIAFCQSLWIKNQSPTTKNLQKVVFIDSLTGWAIGDSGLIIHTSNGGMNWDIQNSNIDLDLLSVTFPNKNIGWALSWTDSPPYGTVILNTSDGGHSWKNEFYNGADVYLKSIYFVDSLNGFIGGYSNGILYTTDGGNVWNQAEIDSFVGYPIYNIVFANKYYGFACGGSTDIMGVIYKTTNGGKNWSGKSVSADPIHSLVILDSLHIVGIGGDIEFGGGIVNSDNGGLSWNYKILNIAGTGLAISFRTLSEGWALIKGGPFIVTYDKGFIWNNYSFPESPIIADIAFTDSLHGYAVGIGGTILKYNIPLTSIDEKIELAAAFSLNQNYPNPFNPSTTISFFIPKMSKIILKIYDILGQEVKSFEHQMDAGEHNIKLTFNNLSSGIYIYTLTAGGYRASKKMIFKK
ncbi:MAG: YCF48-related protein [Ignavibacteriaceae bacterium]|nr:YCF48-related protein [Ignavibacteriaceae bacterium]